MSWSKCRIPGRLLRRPMTGAVSADAGDLVKTQRENFCQAIAERYQRWLASSLMLVVQRRWRNCRLVARLVFFAPRDRSAPESCISDPRVELSSQWVEMASSDRVVLLPTNESSSAANP